MNEQTEIQLTWEEVRGALRRLRGANRFRGNEDHLIHRREVRLFAEARSGRLRPNFVTIHLTARLEDLWAEQFPGGVRSSVRDSAPDGDWEMWLGSLVDAMRGPAYLHTSSSEATYRKAQLPSDKQHSPE